MSFQSVTITIAVIILILCLIFIGVSLYNTKYNTQYPPVEADCPDYWLDKSDGNGSNCVNSQNLGNSKCQGPMNFSTSFWTGDDGLCRKYQWARKCNLSWDGVTNNQDACDNSSDTS
ncbi:hypothetical protein N9O88_01915 [bacterium]|nr:hypothetical protein [bacterium]